MKRLFIRLIPPKEWQIPVVIMLGAIVGLGIYLVQISNVVSYASDDPRACINCHVMTAEYITWDHSSHREVATCNDCHVPHDNLLRKYMFKAKDGMYHASVYTLRMEPQTIVMREESEKVVQANCIRCHQQQVTDPKMTSWVDGHYEHRTERSCFDCHRETPHGRVRSLSATGFHIEPIPIKEEQSNIVPDWLDRAFTSNTQDHDQ